MAKKPGKNTRKTKNLIVKKNIKNVDIKQNMALSQLKKDVRKLKKAPEVKEAPYQSSNAHGAGYLTSGTASLSLAPTVLSPGLLVNDIGAGTLLVDRIGDKINVKSWYNLMRFQIKQSQFNSSTYAYPVDVRIIIARCPTSTVQSVTTAPSFSVFSTLFKYDSLSANQTSAPTNDYLRFRLPINKADWKVAYDKVHRLMPLTLTSTTGLGGATVEKWALMQGVKSHVDVKFDLKKHVSSIMKYTTAAQPDNYKQWFVFHLAIPAGHDSAYDSTTPGTSFLEYQFIERLKYTDS